MPQLDFNVTARGLVKHWNYFSHHIIASPGAAHPMQACFEEAYVVMAAARTMPLLDDARMTAICRRFNERQMRYQGVHWPEMYDMGYGYNRDEHGVPNCSCVADCSSTANGMLEGVLRFPHLPENPKVLASLKVFLDHCLKNYRTDRGVMGGGIFRHRPDGPGSTEYWCADSLFAKSLITYATITGETQYFDAAVPMIEYLATFDYKDTYFKEWTHAGPQQILIYSSEGVVAALASPQMRSRLQGPLQNVIQFSQQAGPAEIVPAQAPNLEKVEFAAAQQPLGHTIWERLVARHAEFLDWHHQNQLADGAFEHPRDDHYRIYEPALAWLLLEAARGVDNCAWVESIAAKQLRFMATDAGKLYYGLRANDFASGLAWLSFATAGEILKKRDPAAWEAALTGVFDRGEEIW